MATNDFLPFAGGAGSNVLTQAAYAALAARTAGFSAGVAKSAELNKVWRQSSIMAAVLAQLIADNTGADVIDDGTTATILDGLKSATAGRLIGVRVFSTAGSSVYTPTTGTKSVVVEAVGAGGGSGGAPATNASQSGLSAPGSNGAYAKARYLSGFSGVTVTVGAGGSAGGPTTAGGNGGTTSFGALLSCPGGRGAGTGVLVGATPVISLGGSGSGSPTGSGILQAIGSFASNNALGAAWGNATGFLPLQTTPIGAGLGASGVYTGASASAVNGNTGENGCVIVWEYA